MRQARVSGQFYPGGKLELRKEIENFLSSLDVTSTNPRKISAAIVPHAGYGFSGKCAGFAYHLLRSQDFDTFLILGTNHSGLGEKIAFSIDDFDTPLGEVECDISLTEDIILAARKQDFNLGVSEEAHRYEHSIEVQLPFLQYVQKKFKIVPVLLRDLSLPEMKKFGKILSDIIKGQKKKIFVLASSDFTHYGKSYGFLPFTENVRENLAELDSRAIQAVLNLDSEEFYIQARKTTICGMNAIAVCTEICKNLKLKPEQLCYYASGDISEDWKNAVGYACIVFA